MSDRSFRRGAVEPLSPQAWQRVESAVFARLDDGVALSMPSSYVPRHARGTRRTLRYQWLVSVGLCVSAAAVASVIHVARSAKSAPSSEAALAASTDGAPPSLDTSPAALHLATGRETRDIAVGEALFTLSEHSEMLARGNDAQGWQVELARGRVDFDVAPRQARPPFVIHSGEVEIRVVGTRFSVRRDGASTEVRVLRGIVEVERQGRVQRLRPGDLWLDGVVAGTSHGARPATGDAARVQSARTPRPALTPDGEALRARLGALPAE